MKLSSLPANQKILITVALNSIIIAGLTFFIIIPNIQDIMMIKNDIDLRRSEIEQKYINGDDLSKLMRNLEQVSKRVESLNNVFIEKDDELAFITELETIAAKNHVTQKINLLPAQMDAKGIFGRTTVQITAGGRFSDIAAYMTDLENLNYYINIYSLQLSREGSRRDAGSVAPDNISLQLSADAFLMSRKAPSKIQEERKL